MAKRIRRFTCWGVIATYLLAGVATASVSLKQSDVNRQWLLAESAAESRGSTPALWALADSSSMAIKSGESVAPKPKSPGKAFVLSLVVPGLGQYYNGNKIKAALFFGIEATSWIIHFKLNGDGNDLTTKFEQFQQTHWSGDRYGGYNYSVYGDSSDADAPTSHHLPTTPTQQYYEMTGKYDQFAWGWDDATLNDHGYSHYADTANHDPFIEVTSGASVPYSANRFTYEGMRHDANNKFDQAKAWVMVAIANHVVSAFEALLSARHNQETGGGKSGKDEFSQWKVEAKLRSVYARRDTPSFRVTYKFY